MFRANESLNTNERLSALFHFQADCSPKQIKGQQLSKRCRPLICYKERESPIQYVKKDTQNWNFLSKWSSPNLNMAMTWLHNFILILSERWSCAHCYEKHSVKKTWRVINMLSIICDAPLFLKIKCVMKQ